MPPPNRVRWSRDELLIILTLYHKLRFGRLNQRQPIIIDLANRIGRTPSAVTMKLSNLVGSWLRLHLAFDVFDDRLIASSEPIRFFLIIAIFDEKKFAGWHFSSSQVVGGALPRFSANLQSVEKLPHIMFAQLDFVIFCHC
jgi:hypothetical protein